MSNEGQGPRFRQLHRALADPLRIRLLEYLIAAPRSAKELAGLVGMRPDRLYHHLARLEEAGLINITEYRRLPGGKVERIYAATDVEPPGDDTSPAETAQFFDAVIEVMRADMNSALMAREAGQRREVSLTRMALQLSDADRAELLAGFERLLLEAQKKSGPDGTWTRIFWTLIDAQDRGRAEGG
jgi:DNA-binding transcriptional ArsR family regulator